MNYNSDEFSSFRSSEEIFKGGGSKGASRKIWCCALVAIVVGFAIGMLVGRFATCPEQKETPQPEGTFLPGVPSAIIQDGDPTISEEIIRNIKAENIREYLRDLSEFPHLAGTEADWKQADQLRNFWNENGIDETFIAEYDVLLSYPNTTDEDNMNQIQILNGSGDIIYKSPLYEDILDPSENKSNVVPPFNAYSKPGEVESDQLIYVNYGRVEDYRHLDKLNITVSGRIVIARYGKIFRGDKAYLAAHHGAIGIILYSDPADYAMGQTDRAYPDDWWLPKSGAQRGTLFLRSGDPLTPGYPSIESAYRVEENDTEAALPDIICHPVGYGVAEKFLQQLTGNEVANDWKGAVPNVTYRYGGQLNNSNWKVKMRISTKNARRKTYNVFGIIRGSIEPDRYVLLGNHRDAWVFGAIDPSSGTATMKEVSRVLGHFVKTKRWRPRRSIVFCSWGSEEYGLVGSVEWVEHYVKNLEERSIAYLNVDLALQGNHSLRALATPMLYDVIFSASKKVANPDGGDSVYKTVYDKWRATFPADETDMENTVPLVHGVGSGSDYAPMVQMIGLPVADVRFTYDPKKYSLSSYPLYHSKYETFKAVDEIMDIGFKRHQATGRIWAEMARHLADSLVIPLDVVNFAKVLTDLMTTLEKDYGSLLTNNSINFDALKDEAKKLSAEANIFAQRVKNVNRNNPLDIRQINDQLMLFERAFLDPQGLPGRPYARHVVFAESLVNTYAGSSFPGLVDALFEIEDDPDQEKRWKVVRKHFSVILFTIESATSTLREVSKFMPEFKGHS